MRVFVSVPTRGRSDEDIQAIKEAALKRVRATLNPSATLTDSYCHENAPVEGDCAGAWYLGESIKRLAQSDAAFFADGWEQARGCRIERAVCEAYGLTILDAPILDRWTNQQWALNECGVDVLRGDAT